MRKAVEQHEYRHPSTEDFAVQRRFAIGLICFVALVAPGIAQSQTVPDELPPGVLVERNVPATMRDGVILRADVYRPDKGGPYPVLVLRTPYGKHGVKPYVQAKAGYIVVCQDARGRYASDGEFESFVRPKTHDAEDGYDTVEWAAKLPGSTGKVGTFGASYNAFLQWRLASLRPPSLSAMSAHSIPARYTDLEGPGSIRPGRRLQWWVTTLSPDIRRRANRPGTHTSAQAKSLWEAGEASSWIHFLPWTELPESVFESDTPILRDWLKHPHQDPWKLADACREITVPNLDVVGWYDHCNGDMRMFRTMVQEGKKQTARENQRIIIGPWSHSPPGKRSYGSIDFGPDAVVNIAELEVRWFDHWLKGKANGVNKDAPVRLFVMGTNRWRDEPAWPVARAENMALFLTGGQANTPAGNGQLLSQIPPSDSTDTFTFDPRDPVPSLYGAAAYTIPADQRPLATRQDILVYQTDPLPQAVEITGNPKVELYVTSTAPDTDFFVRLIDVAPNGLARDVSMGMIRARYRNSLEKPELLKPGEVTRLSIHMSPTSNQFQPGHRIRLDVTSSDFPNYDRNHNTAEDQNADAKLSIARQTIYHGKQHGSKLFLPRVKE